jgi:ABC-type dipeptide/oligopeptide/nickel transport system permease component
VFAAATPAVLAAVLAASGLAVTLTDPMSWREARRIAGFAEAPAPFSSDDPALAALAVAVLALVGAGPWILGAARRLRSEPVHGARLRGLSALRAGWVGWTADTPRATARATHTWIWFCSVLPLVEYLLRIRGVGWYLVRAVPARDYPLLLGSLLALAAIALLGALALELVAVVLDPRDRERWWSRPPAPADEPPSAPLAPFDRPP